MKICVIIDVQNDFLTGTLGTKEACNILPFLFKKIESFCEEDVFFYTLDTHDADYLETVEGKHLPVLHCQKNTWGHQYPALLLNVLKDRQAKALEKSSFASFALVEEIKKCLEGQTCESIVCMGLCTDICVLSNALLLKSAFPNLPIQVYAPACAGTSLQNHQKALDCMRACHIEVLA